jgi:hypothetical protein
MRAGRFGSKAGRVAVVVAFVLGTLVAGTAAANAADLKTGSGVATEIGRQVGGSAPGLAKTLETEWG